MADKQQGDPDVHKGAIEGDRPDDEQLGNPHGDGMGGRRPPQPLRLRPVGAASVRHLAAGDGDGRRHH